jgi:hypothetical protein
MRDANSATTPVGSSHSDVKALELPPRDDDAGLLTLEAQFDELVRELVAVQRASGEFAIRPDQWTRVQDSLQAGGQADADKEAKTKQVETILARLYPIEQAIMQTPARTIRGLGVKARHAAYVMSEYWEVPIDRIDWDARAARLFFEVVSNVAHVSLPCDVAPELETKRAHAR